MLLQFWRHVVRQLSKNKTALHMTSSTVIVTRPFAQAQVMCESLSAAGFRAVAFPMLEITALEDKSEIDSVWADLEKYALVVFVSPNAVDTFFDGHERTWPLQTVAAAVGFSGAEAIRRHLHGQVFEVIAPGVEDRMDSEALLELIDVSRFDGKKALIVRGQTGRELLFSQLTARGMEVVSLIAYHRQPPVFDITRAKLLVSLLSEQNEWVITSSESLRFLISFAERLGEDRAFVAKLQSQRLFVPHVRIAETARQLGFSRIELTGSGDQNLMIALSNKV